MIHSPQLSLFAAAIESRLGLQPDPARRDDLAVLFTQRIAATGHPTPQQYLDHLPATPSEWEILAPLLTVPETYFFRMPDHFAALAETALPPILRANALRAKVRPPTLRILSAGCATGEEPYTIAMLLHERFPELRNWTVEILGLDLSPAALDRARAGLYTEWSLRATSAERRRAFFTPAGNRFQLAPSIRAAVDFRLANLLDLPSSLQAPFDIIFCRNVLIYFSPAAIHRVIDSLTALLAPAGFLFLGPAETLRGVSRNFHLCHTHETFFYQRKDGALRPSSSPAAIQPAIASPPQLPPAPSSPPTAPDGQWYDAILRSSDRLDFLFAPGRPPSTVPARSIPTAPRPTPAPAPSFDLKNFLALSAAERFSQALDLLDLLPPGSASTDDLRLMRAVMLTNLNRREESERECRLLLEADELNAGAHYLLGLCREQAGDLAEASEHARMATYLDPSFSMAHLHQGLLARRLNQPEVARESLNNAFHALDREGAARLALFGGGFSRDILREICQRELRSLAPTDPGHAPSELTADHAAPGGRP